MTETPPPAYPVAQPLSPSDERLWSTLIHIGGIVTGFIAPLIGYLVLKDRSRFALDNSRNALNFQLTVLIGYIASAVLMFVIVGFLTYFAVAILSVVLGILAAVAANRGEVYKYPLTIQFVK